MTAINMFSDNRYAYLATDGASYDVTTGRVVSIGQKAIQFPSLRMVLATSGGIDPTTMLEIIDEHHRQDVAPTQASILATLPNAVREARRRRLAAHEGTNLPPGALCILAFVAFYDAEHGEPRTCRIASEGAPGVDPADAYRLIDFPTGIVQPALSDVQQVEIFSAGYSLFPRRELMMMLELQRRVPCAVTAGGCSVGGIGHFYRVGADGIIAEPLIEWPEGEGEMLDATRSGRPIPSIKDYQRAV